MKNHFLSYLLILVMSWLILTSCKGKANTDPVTNVKVDRVPPTRTIISTEEFGTVTPTSTESTPTSPESIALTPTSFDLTLKTKAYLYNGPRLDYGTAEAYPRLRGEEFRVIAKNLRGDWLLVKAADGTQGWLYVAWASIPFDPRSAPTAETIPPPPRPTVKPKRSYP